MNLREKLEIVKDRGETIGILIGREKTELIRGPILKVGEDYFLLQPEGS